MATAAVVTACAAVGVLRPALRRLHRASKPPIAACKPQQSVRSPRWLPPAVAAAVAAAATSGSAADQAAPGPDDKVEQVTVQSLLTDYLFAVPPAFSPYRCTEEEAGRMLEGIVGAIPAGAEDAEELPPYFLGPLLLAASDPSLPAQAERLLIVDGQQRILTLCLLLAAARERFLAAGNSAHLERARQIKRLLVQSGNILEGVPEQVRIHLQSEESTAFLCRLLLDVQFQQSEPAEEELAGEAQSRLWANQQLFRRRLADQDLPRLELLVQFILSRCTATVTTKSTALEALNHFMATASSTSLTARGFSQSHLPNISEELLAKADFAICHGGAYLALHSAMLANGSKVLRQALSDVHGAGSGAQAAAVQQAFGGHPLADVQLFLKLLYNGHAAAAGITDADALPGVVALAIKLEAPAVLQACDERLVELLSPVNFGRGWAGWLVLADRYGLRQLKPLAARHALVELLGGYARRADLEELSALSMGTYQLLLEAAVVAVQRSRSGINIPGRITDCIPRNLSDWSKPGDFL